jgi:hypothetical protein
MSSTADHQDEYPQPIKGESYQHFEARVREHELENEYHQLLKSGMFWEFYPELTGDFEKDKKDFGAYRALHRPFVNAAPTPKEWEKVPVCSITEAVKSDLDAATQKGYQEYGCTLDREDLSLLDWLEHTYQETLDKAKYLKRAIKKLRDGQ